MLWVDPAVYQSLEKSEEKTVIHSHLRPCMAHKNCIVVGLVGAIGAGKTTVAECFRASGAKVVSADALVHRLLRQNRIRQSVAAALQVTLPLQELALKKTLASVVFSDEEKRKALEALLHPHVDAEIRKVIRQSESKAATPKRVVVLDIPLLLEADMDQYCDELLYVEAPEGIRLQRLSEHRQWPRGEAERRQRCQLPLQDKKRQCSEIIHNDGDTDRTRSQVQAVYNRLIQDGKGGHRSRAPEK